MESKESMFTSAITLAAAMLSFVAIAAPEIGVELPHCPPDGYADVDKAHLLGQSGKLDEGREFIAALRAKPADGMNLEERQSIDMAEFALLRHDLAANKLRCVELLRSACDAVQLWISEDGEEWAKKAGFVNGGEVLKADLRKDSPAAKFVKVGFAPDGKRGRLLFRRFSFTVRDYIKRRC